MHFVVLPNTWHFVFQLSPSLIRLQVTCIFEPRRSFVTRKTGIRFVKIRRPLVTPRGTEIPPILRRTCLMRKRKRLRLRPLGRPGPLASGARPYARSRRACPRHRASLHRCRSQGGPPGRCHAPFRAPPRRQQRLSDSRSPSNWSCSCRPSQVDER